MKYLFILFFAAFSLTASAQKANSEVNRLMEQELNIIQKDLQMDDATITLSTEQKTKLKKLLLVKAEKMHAARTANLGKLEVSQAHTKINKEFDPAVLEILNSEQKKAFKASPRNVRKYAKKN